MQWYGCLERHPKSHTIFSGILHFKHTHPRCPKTLCLACDVEWYGCLEHHPRTHSIFFGIVQFRDIHPRYPKTPFLGCGVQWYGCLERHPRTHTIFLPLCSSKTSILDTQKHLSRVVVCCGMGVWSATPELTAFFGIVQFKDTHPGYPKNTFSGLWCAAVWLFEAPPQNPPDIFWHSALQRHPP